MGRQLMTAAVVGAGTGALVAIAAYITVTLGADIYFRLTTCRTSRHETGQS